MSYLKHNEAMMPNPSFFPAQNSNTLLAEWIILFEKTDREAVGKQRELLRSWVRNIQGLPFLQSLEQNNQLTKAVRQSLSNPQVNAMQRITGLLFIAKIRKSFLAAFNLQLEINKQAWPVDLESYLYFMAIAFETQPAAQFSLLLDEVIDCLNCSDEDLLSDAAAVLFKYVKQINPDQAVTINTFLFNGSHQRLSAPGFCLLGKLASAMTEQQAITTYNYSTLYAKQFGSLYFHLATPCIQRMNEDDYQQILSNFVQQLTDLTDNEKFLKKIKHLKPFLIRINSTQADNLFRIIYQRFENTDMLFSHKGKILDLLNQLARYVSEPYSNHYVDKLAEKLPELGEDDVYGGHFLFLLLMTLFTKLTTEKIKSIQSIILQCNELRLTFWIREVPTFFDVKTRASNLTKMNQRGNIFFLQANSPSKLTQLFDNVDAKIGEMAFDNAILILEICCKKRKNTDFCEKEKIFNVIESLYSFMNSPQQNRVASIILDLYAPESLTNLSKKESEHPWALLNLFATDLNAAQLTILLPIMLYNLKTHHLNDGKSVMNLLSQVILNDQLSPAEILSVLTKSKSSPFKHELIIKGVAELHALTIDHSNCLITEFESLLSSSF